MRLFYCDTSKLLAGGANFGDDLNPWLWPKILPGFFDKNEDELFYGIGTLLNDRVPKNKKKVIFGSGIGYGDLPAVDNNWEVHFVRGPLSAKALNLDSSKFITDPAILIRPFFEKSNTKKYAVSYIPHWTSMMKHESFWEATCSQAGINLIDPRGTVVDVINQINQSKKVITEAMHGAIIADTLRVPWIPVKTSHILKFKWDDWTQSLELDYKPVWIPYSHRWLYPLGTYFDFTSSFSSYMALKLKKLAKKYKGNLSKISVLDSKFKEMEVAIQRLKIHYP